MSRNIFLQKYIVFLSLLFCFGNVSGQYTFLNLSLEDNLPTDYIYDIHSSDGYYWFSSKEGTYKFLGKNKFKKYSLSSGANETDLWKSHSRWFFKSSVGFYVLTPFGTLYKYDPVEDGFSKFIDDLYVDNAFHSSVLEKDSFLVASTPNGIIRYDLEGNVESKIVLDASQMALMTVSSVVDYKEGYLFLSRSRTNSTLDVLDFNLNKTKSFVLDEVPVGNVKLINDESRNGVWILSHRSGLYFFDFNKEKITKEYFTDINVEFADIIKTSNDEVMISTNGAGLFVINKEGNYQNYLQEANVDKSLSSNQRYHFHKSSNDLIWIGSHNGGVDVVDPKPYSFHLFSEKNSVLTNSSILSLISREDGILVGTDGGGLYEIERTSTSINKLEGGFPPVIISMDINKSNDLLLGSWELGAYQLNENYQLSRKFNKSNKTLTGNHVWSIKSKNGKTWFGLTDEGVVEYDGKSSISIFNEYLKGLSGNVSIQCMLLDGDVLYIGTETKGLFHYNTVTKKLEKLKDELGLYDINDLKIRNNQLWIATRNKGLVYYDINKGLFYSYKLPRSFRNINSIEFHKGKIWFSSEIGIGCSNMKNGDFTLYSKNDGIPVMEFNDNSSIKDKVGNIYFGGTNGLIQFNPDKIEDRSVPTSVLITSILINGKEYNYSQNKDEKLSIQTSDVVNIRCVSSFPFFDDIADYKYRIKGISKDWQNFNEYINLSNLPEGDHVLEIASDILNANQSTYNIELDLKVKVPLLQNPFFYSLLLLFLVLVYILYSIFERRKLEEWNKNLQTGIDEATEKLENKNLELEQSIDFRDKLYGILSHDIKESIFSMNNFLGGLLHSNDTPPGVYDHFSGRLKSLYQNSVYQKMMINDVLSWTIINNQKLKPVFEDFNLTELIEDVLLLYKLNIQDKVLDVHKTSEKQYVYSDRKILGTVIRNVISNAINHSPANKSIFIEVDVEETVWVTISNYISDNSLYQVSSSGIGFGTEIINEFVGLLDISFDTKIEEGMYHSTLGLKQAQNDYPTIIEAESETIDNYDLTEFKDLSILIIDNNIEYLKYLEQELNEHAIINLVTDTDKAIEVIKDTLPSIILSDYSMGDKNGLDIYGMIMNDSNVSHIPFILLSSLTSTQLLSDALSKGVDYVLDKTQGVEVIKASIRSVLLSQKRQYKNYSITDVKDSEKEQAESFKNDIERKFLEQLNKVISENIDNSSFNSTLLAQEMYISKSILYSKVKTITGLTVHEYMRNYRLKKAVELLKDPSNNITDIAFKCGFNSLSYFSSSFSKLFSITPLSYRKKLFEK